MSETTTQQPAPPAPVKGGSYVRDPETGALELQHETLLVAPEPATEPEAPTDAAQE